IAAVQAARARRRATRRRAGARLVDRTGSSPGKRLSPVIAFPRGGIGRPPDAGRYPTELRGLKAIAICGVALQEGGTGAYRANVAVMPASPGTTGPRRGR